MKFRQAGFGGLHLLMVVLVIGAISTIAVPKYNAFMTKAKLTEAFSLAGESKKKLSMFYMTNSKFPQFARDIVAMKTVSLSPPEFVHHMAIEPNSDDHEVIVKVFLRDDVVKNPAGVEQYVFIAGDRSESANATIEWTCGARGIDVKLLPEECRG